VAKSGDGESEGPGRVGTLCRRRTSQIGVTQ
jgi:hypothetical protein